MCPIHIEKKDQTSGNKGAEERLAPMGLNMRWDGPVLDRSGLRLFASMQVGQHGMIETNC
jgi:hypothetical protein